MPANRGNEKIIYLTFGVVFIIALVVVLFLFFNKKPCPDVKFDASSQDITVSQLVTFTDHTVGEVKARDWDFGDNSAHSQEQVATHKFSKEGTYNIVLKLNNSDKCSSSLQVKVSKDVVVVLDTQVRLTPVIVGPASAVAYVGKAVKFKDNTPGATSWEWYFENGKDILTVKEPSYTFMTPGERTISLVINGTSNRTDFKLKVMAEPLASGGGGRRKQAPPVTEQEFKQMLYDLHNEVRQATDFNPYFCNDLTKKIKVNGQLQEFSSFCKQYMISDNTKLGKITIEKDPETNCIVYMEIERK